MATFLHQQSAQLNKVKERNIRSNCRQQLFHSLRAHQYNSGQLKIFKDQSAETTARVVSVTYRLWLLFLINRVLNLTKLRSVICDQSVDSSCFALWELISTAQIKWGSWRTRVLKLLLELWALHIACGYPSWSIENKVLNLIYIYIYIYTYIYIYIYIHINYYYIYIIIIYIKVSFSHNKKSI